MEIAGYKGPRMNKIKAIVDNLNNERVATLVEQDFKLSKTVCGTCCFNKELKEFIKRDTQLINDFACGGITFEELKQEREKLIGDLK